jgi:hypothetical protein
MLIYVLIRVRKDDLLIPANRVSSLTTILPIHVFGFGKNAPWKALSLDFGHWVPIDLMNFDDGRRCRDVLKV